MKENDYFSSLNGRTVAVLGLGVSNRPLAKRLLEAGAKLTIRDKSGAPSGADEFEKAGARLVLGPDYLKDMREEVIFRSPGIRPDTPELSAAKARGAVITSEMEAFFDVCPCKIIGVTGSDGKTTTATLISELLTAAGHKVFLGGNIGTPLLCRTGEMTPQDFAVVELSSFQLMNMARSPEIAVITNISPNHLDWHRDMGEYVNAKKNIFRHQSDMDILVLDADDRASLALAAEAVGAVKFFSANSRPQKGAWLSDGVIYSVSGRTETPITEVSRIKLPGRHNVYNFMAALCATRAFVPAEVAAWVAETFKGVEHRLEFVREKNGVRFVNDSIASSPTRTAAALDCYESGVVLIAGGKDKGVPFDTLAPLIAKTVSLLVLTGHAAEQIEAAVGSFPGCPTIVREPNFKKAVLAAAAGAKPGETVLLSPACTSFDCFKNFDERGKYFKEIVNEL